ncbi:hypothetical protein [Mesorhizobium sp.]|uniref:hypothetical protein n=1 Tax=Mesorhizobium sp. TaxID=1871066 RepID=UPI00257FA599|nr:hypothetical protein [Mesorhizobium sp.]
MKPAGEGIPSTMMCAAPVMVRKLVRQVIRGHRTDIFRVRQSSLEVWLPFLDGQ